MSPASWLRDARQRLDARRSTHPQVDTALQLIELQDESGGALLAAAIAFRFFLFIIPFVFVVVMGLGLGAEAAGANVKEVARRAGITGVAAAAVESGATASSTARWLTLLIALIALVRGARNLIRALWVAHALIWRVRPQKLRHPTRLGLVLIGVFATATLLIRVTYAVRAVSLAVWVVACVLHTLALVSIWGSTT